MARKRNRGEFFREHSLSIVIGAIWLTWLGLYARWDPSTHLGSFFGNSIADWLGALTITLITKVFYERGSQESKQPRIAAGLPLAMRFLEEHSLTLFMVITGGGWVAWYLLSDPSGKVGQVIGNVVSEWGQLVAMILLTKRLHERGSKA